MASSVSRSSDSSSRTSARSTQSTSSARSATRTTSTPGTRASTPTGHTARSSFTQPGAAPTGSLRPGARGPEVRALQDQLRAAGFDPGRTDGIFGPRTERAVRDFQQSRGLTVDGIAGRRTFAALSGTDGMGAPNNAGVNGTARLNGQPNGPGMTTGSITVNGNTYQFNSGSGSLFSVPQGEYRVTAHRNTRSERAFTRDGVGYSFLIEDARRPGTDRMYDARAGRDRTNLRIHPDGGATGTAGCIGIVGDAETQRRFREDMNAELARNGGVYTLRVQ